MGRITNSFKGQIGRDTGRVVSNLIWGDKHASVYRRAENRKSEALKLQREQFEADQEWQEQNSIDEKIQFISASEIPSDRAGLVNMLSQLRVLLKSNNYKDVLSAVTEKQNKLKNQYTDAIITKYEEVLIIYASMYPDDAMLKHYKSTLKSVKMTKYVRKYILLIWFFGLMLVIGLIGIISELI